MTSVRRLLSCSPKPSIALLLWLALPALTRAKEAEKRISDPPAPAGWLENVQADLRDREYELSWQTQPVVRGLEPSWHAPNHAHGFRTYFTPGGIHVVSRTEETPSWQWGLSLLGYGRGGTTWPMSRGTSSTNRNRIEFRRSGVDEWYENTPRGLEQGFVLHAPPEEIATRSSEPPLSGLTPRLGVRRGDDPPDLIHVDLALTGTLSPAIAPDGQAIDFATPEGRAVVRYAALRVVDARSQGLPTWIEGFSGPNLRGIRLVVDARDAVYPITVDPLMTSPAWTAESEQASAYFGSSVATAGDVNGDGYSDVIVGAYYYDNGQTDEGRAFVYLGSAAGLATTAAWTAESDQAVALFGSSVATAGDVNGDGYSDVVVGAFDYDNGQTDEGRAFVYLGSAVGLATTAAWTAEGDQKFANFGVSVATAGDVNGDAYSDVIVGASLYDNGRTDEGGAFVYLGSITGLATTAVWTAESNQAHAFFGFPVATAGDVNGDGYSDVIVGAYGYGNVQAGEGRAFVYHGSSSGPATTPAWIAESDQMDAFFGRSVATAGDVNGDGYSDVIVGAYGYGNVQAGEGRAFVYFGSAAGLATTAVWTAESDQAHAFFGGSVATAGDVNGDGYSDVIVGAYGYGNGEGGEGRTFVYFGSAAGLATTAVWTAESDQASAAFGGSVATAGDVNGDGYSDVIVGAKNFENGQTGEGRAYVYHGSASGLATSSGWTGESDQVLAHFGYSVATAGDVNGDGYSDVIVGAVDFDNGEADEGRAFVYLGSAEGPATTPAWTAESDQANARFGVSVATAGDVNGDGYSDVVVGANSETTGDEGRAFVYLGSAVGLATTAAWTAESDQVGARYGISVASAGDVNGDGYSDVVVGAPLYNNGQTAEGRAFVYHGSAVGLATAAAWMAESDQKFANFGLSVATAGDVNGDGYSDVIVGASAYDNGQGDEGRAFVYHGSAVGLATTAAWTAESDQAHAFFGFSVATAGDVNGDGYSDVIVGAYWFDNGQLDEGRAYVYHGSAGGLSTAAAWTAESDQVNPYFGWSVATAGDVNGDGYSDVIAGAPNYNSGQGIFGQAFVYLGSAVGLGTSPAWTAESDQGGINFGWSVATAGDVNGDGYSDVIVGGYAYANGQGGEGRAFLYYGNGGQGLSLNPQQRRSDDESPVAHLGVSDSPNSFRLAALGRSPFGRSRLKLEQEVKPLGSLFNGAGTQTAAAWTDSGTAGAPLNELAPDLLASTPYHWRVRLRYDPAASPFQQSSRWLTVPWKGWQEWMLRTGSPVAVAAGRVPDGSTGTPLLVAKAGGGQITLTWDVSCLVTDTDYEIYEGTIGGNFTSHTSLFCTTSGATAQTFTPSVASTYYLVVPRNSTQEGSYGTNSAGTERPQGLNACLPQQIGVCP